MAAPRLVIDLNKIYHNAQELISRLSKNSVSVTGVTNSVLGSTQVAKILLRAGVQHLGDSRIENLKEIRLSTIQSATTSTPLMLLRCPMLSQVDQVIKYADISLNSEVSTIRALSCEAKKLERPHKILLMVELGDLREGILPGNLLDTVRQVFRLPFINIVGIGTNLASHSGVIPDAENMTELSQLAEQIEVTFGIKLDVISGGNSASLSWAFNQNGSGIGRINNLRLGESILLGRESLHHRAIEGLYTDAFTLSAEVIESKLKPSRPTGVITQTSLRKTTTLRLPGTTMQSILALGIQDIDPSGLQPPKGIRIQGSSSDQLVVHTDQTNLTVGQEMSFQLEYCTLLRAMMSPSVSKEYIPYSHAQTTSSSSAPG